MAENLIFVPESNEQKVRTALQERVVLALEIARDSSAEYIKRLGVDGDPTERTFIAIFNAVFSAL
jgi:hypothetical protein